MADDLKYTEEDIKQAKQEATAQATVLGSIKALKAYVELEFSYVRKAIEGIDSRMTALELHKADKTVITSWETALASVDKKVEDGEKRTEDLEKTQAKLTGALVIISGVWVIVSAVIVAWLTKTF